MPRRSAILSLGTRLAASCETAAEIEGTNDDIAVTVADARFMKPGHRSVCASSLPRMMCDPRSRRTRS